MDGRISVGILAAVLALGAAGCVTTQSSTNVPNPDKNPAAAAANTNGNTTFVKADDTPWPKRDRESNRKYDPLPTTEIAFGRMKEAEADAAHHKNNQEAQARLRDEARRAYQQAIKLDPNCLEAYRHLGHLYIKMGDSDRALETYQKALAKHAKESGIWYDMGLCYTRRKDFAESTRCLSKALELEPENLDYMKKLGMTLAWVGQIDRSVAYLTRGHQSAALAHYDIARVLAQKGQIEPAKQHLHIALHESPQLEGAGEMLAWLENPNAGATRRFSLEGPQ
jgi:tetratricopeptide (TPR) repeat protein